MATALTLSACGGGDPVQDTCFVAFYGDSITSGASGDGFLPVRPVDRMTELSRGAFIGLDRSKGGASIWDAANGAPGMPFHTFAEDMATTPARVAVIRYAQASALNSPGEVFGYAATLKRVIQTARDAGVIPVLVGVANFTAPDPKYGVTASQFIEILGNVIRFHGTTRRVAIETGTQFIDTMQVPFNGASDIADIIHPTQAYSDRMSAYIVERLLPTLKGTP